MSNAFTEGSLLDALARGAVVVLPNRRAARSLRRAFEKRERDAGRLAWQSPSALTWTDWARSLWTELTVTGREDRLLLNAAQEHSLWREIIASSTAGKTLSSADALAEMAGSAYSLAAAHLATPRIRATANTFDSRAFAGWAESFAKISAGEDCLPAARLDDALSEHVRSGALRVGGAVLVVGFEDLSPAQVRLIEALRAGGADIAEGAVEGDSSREQRRARTVVGTPRDELIFAARWLREQFSDAGAEAPKRIAVVLTRPEESRAEMESVFREVLAPELQPVAADTSTAPWEFVSGAPLATQPMIVDALALIRLVRGPLAIERLSALLRSPFIGVESERLRAAPFDAQVLRRGPYLMPEVDLDGLSRLVRVQSQSRGAAAYRPAWLRPLIELQRARLRRAANRGYAEWAEVIRELLRTANWPGDRPPTPAEFACARAWDANLDLLATLDFRGSRVSFSAAVEELEHVLAKARVSPLPADAPVEIMRPEDAEGSSFDAVVLLHATDESWPEAVGVDPLLGWPLQRELGLAGADPSRDVARSRARLESLVRRSSSVLALSASADERGALRPSPLLEQLGVVAVAAEEMLAPIDAAQAIAEEIVADDVALPALPSPELHGGASVLKLQAACGFQAFAEMRLRAEVVDGCELGLDAGERGSLVHRALEELLERDTIAGGAAWALE